MSKAEYGFKFWTVEAGLIGVILSMHSVDNLFDETAATTTWIYAAPHHVACLHSDRAKLIYLSFKNVAGRRLALSRAGDANASVVVHFGVDIGILWALRREISVICSFMEKSSSTRIGMDMGISI